MSERGTNPSLSLPAQDIWVLDEGSNITAVGKDREPVLPSCNMCRDLALEDIGHLHRRGMPSEVKDSWSFVLTAVEAVGTVTSTPSCVLVLFLWLVAMLIPKSARK